LWLAQRAKSPRPFAPCAVSLAGRLSIFRREDKPASINAIPNHEPRALSCTQPLELERGLLLLVRHCYGLHSPSPPQKPTAKVRAASSWITPPIHTTQSTNALNVSAWASR
jgi:hypothetical protein